MNARETKVQSLTERARQNRERPAPHPFKVGETYENRQGKYEVMQIAPPKMTIRYEHGGLLTADIAILARIWDNLQMPPERPEPVAVRRQRPRTPPDRARPGLPRRFRD